MSFQAVDVAQNTQNDPEDIEMTSSDLSHLYFNSDNEYGLDDRKGNIAAPLMLHQHHHGPQEPPDTCPMTSSDDDDEDDE
jgi:hypothetical protein